MKIRRIQYKRYTELKNFKNDIFRGNILCFFDYPSLKKIKEKFESYFFDCFKKTYNASLLNSFSITKVNDEINLFKLQEIIKNCKFLKSSFTQFFIELGFDLNDLYIDEITLRYSPRQGDMPYGKLKPTSAHRDTWASNIFHQINWWIPMHNVFSDNSIFIVPAYFKKKVPNNSKTWTFKKYKSILGYPSVPISNENFNPKDILNINLRSHEILCFSGNHIHGSNVGKRLRFNIETRTVSSSDPKNYKIPENIDSLSNVTKKVWFKNIITGEKLG